MALNDILEKIKKETQEKIKKIQEEAKAKIQEIETEYNKKITFEKEKILDCSRKEIAKKTKQLQIKTSLETKNLFLAQRQKVFDDVWQKVLDELAELDEQKYSELIADLLEKCPKEKGIIIAAKGREKITQETLKKVKRDYLLSDKSLSVTGGFIYSSGSLEINATFEELIKELKEKMNIEVTNILFK